MFPRECCGGGRTRSYSASCLSIRLTRPRVWSLLFIGAETLVISQFSYNAVLRGRGLSRFSPVRCQFVRGGQCAVLLPLGKEKNGYGVFVRKLPSSVAALLPSIAVSSSGVRPLVLRRWRDSDWSDQGLSVPKRMWSEPCVQTIWTNFSLERKLLSGVLFKTSAVSSHTFGVPISWSHTSSYIDQPPIWANTSLCGGTSFIILARRSTLASSQLGKLISIPQWIDTIRSLSFAHSIILRHLGSSILVRWNTG